MGKDWVDQLPFLEMVALVRRGFPGSLSFSLMKCLNVISYEFELSTYLYIVISPAVFTFGCFFHQSDAMSSSRAYGSRL